RERFGVELIDGIGTTEILHIFLSNRPGAARPGSSGLPVPGYEAIVVDDEGRPVPPGEIGNLRVKGDSIMAYYWNKHEKTKETLFGPWIQTGDKYIQDKDGYFWFCGRADDMLKVGGIWVSPVEVEATLVRHAAVVDLRGWDDFGRLPFTWKREFVEDQAAHPPFGTNLTYPLERYVRVHQTSGTSAEPIRWLETQASWDWWTRCWAFVLRAAGV